MPRSHLFRADRHNFNLRVQVEQNGMIRKPRNIQAEWLLLDATSLFRQTLENMLPESLSLRDILPATRFGDVTAGPTLTYQTVPHIVLAPLQRPLTSLDCSRLGALLSLFQWLGLSDLHSENLLAGVDEAGQFKVVPCDCEMIFYDFVEFKKENALFPFPSAHESARHYGLIFLEDYLQHGLMKPDDFLAVTTATFEMAEILVLNSNKLSEAVEKSLNLTQLPIRVVLRETAQYTTKTIQDLIPEEQEQLTRGDVPYFFQLPFDAAVYYWKSLDDWGPVKTALLAKDLNLRQESDQSQFLKEINFTLTRTAEILAKVCKDDFVLKSKRTSVVRMREHLYVETEASASKIKILY